jgi:hypothetical protein
MVYGNFKEVKIMKLIKGQYRKEKEYLNYIQRKNVERERLPRGQYIKKSH